MKRVGEHVPEIEVAAVDDTEVPSQPLDEVVTAIVDGGAFTDADAIRVAEAYRKCRVASCTNRGRHRVLVWVGGEQVAVDFCELHHAEYRADEVRE